MARIGDGELYKEHYKTTEAYEGCGTESTNGIPALYYDSYSSWLVGMVCMDG